MRIIGRIAFAAGTALAAMAVTLMTPCADAAGRDQFVRLDTTKGPIVLRIFYSIVPYTAGNFLDLVDSGFYSGLTFHRVENWVVQGGDPNGNGSGNATDANTGQPKFLRLEINSNLTHNQAGMVAMARSNDPNSASCQFYILKSPMPQLNGKYAVFGKVVGGMQNVYQIQRGDRILSATILEQNNNSGGQSSSGSSSSSADFTDTTKAPKPKESGF